MIEHFGAQEMLYLISTVRWTLLLTLIAFAFGSVGGAVLALLRLSRHPLIRGVAYGVIELVQSVPVLMVLFLSYFGLSAAGIDLPPLPAASLALGVWAAAYLADIWRSAIEAVPY